MATRDKTLTYLYPLTYLSNILVFFLVHYCTTFTTRTELWALYIPVHGLQLKWHRMVPSSNGTIWYHRSNAVELGQQATNDSRTILSLALLYVVTKSSSTTVFENTCIHIHLSNRQQDYINAVNEFTSTCLNLYCRYVPPHQSIPNHLYLIECTEVKYLIECTEVKTVVLTNRDAPCLWPISNDVRHNVCS